MKRLELLITECTVQGQTMELDYRKQLMGYLETPPGGATIVEQHRIGRVYDALEKSEGTVVLLEDADHETLCKILKEIKFAVYNKKIVDMVDSILDAPDSQLQQVFVDG